MKGGKDSKEVVEFMVLFQRLRDIIGDDPTGLETRASADHSLKRLCDDIGFAASFLTMNEKRQRRLFSAPVDAKFVAAWRRYEESYASPIFGIFLSNLNLGSSASQIEKRSRADVLWESADGEAKEQAAAIESAIEFASEQATDDWRDFGEGFRESIEEGSTAWRRLKKETGFDLRGVFRRRALVPFVNIPTHVSNHHGENEKLSLLTHLQEAHDAYIFGVHFAALALMRSVLEVTLTTHYRAPGKDLKERIENCEGLPHRCSKTALDRIRRLANVILHLENNTDGLPKDFERELLRLLNVLRALIEGAPSSRRR